jgi:signal transduction histidine kinase
MNSITSTSIGKGALATLLIFIYLTGSSQTVSFEDVDAVVANTDSLEQRLETRPDEDYLKRLLILENNWLRTGNPKFGSKLDRIGELATKQKRSDILANYHFLKSFLFVKNRQQGEAFESLDAAVKAFEVVKDTVGVINSYNRLNDLSLRDASDHLRNAETAIESAKKAPEMANMYGNEVVLSSGKLRSGYASTKVEESMVLEIVNKQLEIIGDDPDLQQYRVKIMSALARYYVENKNYDKAYTVLKETFAKYGHTLSSFSRNVFFLSLTKVCILSKRFDEAEKYLQEIVANTRSAEFRSLRQDAFTKYRDLYTAQSKFQQALVYADSSSSLQNLIYNTENINKLNELEAQYKSKEGKSENEALAREDELVKSRSEAITSEILSLFLTGGLVFLYRSRQIAQTQSVEIRRLSQIQKEYMTIVAHDLRGPLYAMQGMYDMVKNAIRDKRYETLEEVAVYIDGATIKTQQLLDNLLTWGMARQEEVPYNPTQVNVAASIQEIRDMYVSMGIFYDFNFVVNCKADLHVYADSAGFSLILRNLIANAAKHLPVTGGRLEVNVLENNEQGVVLTISDNGEGMEAEKLTLINEVFQRPEKFRAGQDGLGLGIILVGKFTQRNKGNIVAKQLEGTGVSFQVVLPDATAVFARKGAA